MTSAATGITSTIQLTGDITPPNPNTAIVEINAKNAGSTLVIDGTSNGYSIGTLALPMSKIKFTGDGTIEVTAISTPAIEVSVSKLAIAEVNSDVFFTGPATLAGVQINGDIDFQGNAANVVLASDTANNLPALISGNIASTGTQNGTIEFMDDGTIGTVDSNGVSTNTITNIAMLKAGADNSTVTINSGGDMSIGEIQGTGTGNIYFTQTNPAITANINSTGGSPVNFFFNNGGSISGDTIGSENNPIGNITILDGTLKLGTSDNSVITFRNVYLGPKAIINFDTNKLNDTGAFILNYAGTVPNAFGIFAETPIEGGVKFDGDAPTVTSGTYGSVDSPLGVIQIDGGDVTFNTEVYVTNLNFTTTNAVTTTFNNDSQIGGVITTGNGIHTIALAGNTTIGNSDIGGPSNTLKTIQFIKDVTFTDNSPSVCSTVTSNAPNQGTIVFTADNGFTDDLGDSTNSLKTVQFSSVEGTVKGDTYSENVSIDSGKSAIFSGYNSRSTSVPSSTVGGVTVPRSTPQFNYQTVVSSSDFQGTDNTTSAKFTNAALVQAPINNGNLTFEDDVWLQKPVTNVNTITFASQKNALISAGIGANNIVADQTTMVFVGDNATIPAQGNITGSNVTFDLGNNTVVYDGTATPTGNLVFNVLYDTTNAGKTANTNSGNIVLANGAVLDLSKVDSIQVVLTAQNNPNGIRLGSAYPLVSSKGGSIIPGAAAKLPFNVIANEKNFVRWVINDDSFILYTATADIIPTISRPSIAIHRIIHSNPNIIIPDIDIINPVIGGFTPATPGTGSVTGGVFTPVDPNIPGNNVVVTGNNPVIVNGGNTPSIGSGGNTPNGPVTGGSVIGGVYTPSNPSNSVVPSGPGTGGSTPSIGSGGNTPNGPVTGGSVIGGVYTPSNSSNSVVPSGPGTGGSTPSIGSGGNTPSIVSGGNTPSIRTGGNTPSIGSGGNTPNGPVTGGSVIGGVYTPSNPSNSVVPSGPGTGGSTPSIGSGGNTPSIGTGGSTGNNPYTPSVGTGGNTGNSPSNYNPSVGTGGNTGNSPSNYNPSVGTGGNTGNSPSNYNPSVGTGGNTGNSPSNYNPSVGTGGSTGNSPSNYNPSVGTGGNTGNSPSNYNPSVGTGGNTGNSPSNYNPSVGTGGSTGNSPSNYNPASGGNVGATGNNAYGGNTGNSPSNYNYNSSAGSNGGVSNTGSSPNGYKSSTGSSYNGSATNGAVSVVPANNASGSTYQPSNNNGSASDISAIGSSRDNQVGAGGSGNGGSSNSGISRSNANDGFNAAKDNASMGNQEINKRMEAVKNADGTSPDAEEADSRKRGAAVGGGDCDDYNTGNVYGVWISPYYGKAVQKALSDGFSGYTAKSEGGSVGVDTVINDNIVLGAAYTRIDTKLRYKDSKSGNVTKVETNMGSVYGLYNFADNLFIEGITTYSRSRIKTNELRGTVDGTENAYGKYNSTSYSAQVVGGYNYLWKDSSLAPMAGLRFTRIKDFGYQEQGTTFQNLTIKKRQYNKVEGILGAEIKTTFYKDDFIIRPQAHAFINYDFSGKTPAIVAELNGINEPLPVQTPKATKMLYDLGAGVVVKKGNMEYGVHYGLNFAKKYHAQSGTLRLKLNF
ncbi:autotransporter domain-containing protein [Rickettsia bellii]|uniref:autotransporter domain-containing protein n=1 Tax=Rickettsia bellii TaxID=33990 RepID=UPI0009E573FC|nr:autotransporter domain-containing protein [Rickettsia bellii]